MLTSDEPRFPSPEPPLPADEPRIPSPEPRTRGAAPIYAVLRSFAAELARAGLRHVCIAPGARSTPLTLVLAAQPALRVWSHVDERSAAFFALGLAKASRAPAAVVCTSGSAAANLFPAVVEAAYAHVPLLLLTADRPPELRECGAPQAIDQIKLFGAHAKWFAEVGGAEAGDSYFRSLACRAVATAAATPAGPVHLNLPLREPLVPDDPADVVPAGRDDVEMGHGRPKGHPDTNAPHTTLYPPARAASDPALEALAATLNGTPHGVLVVGPLDADTRTSAALLRLAARCGYPVLADATSQLRNAAAEGALVVDTYDVVLRDPIVAARLKPDAVLRIGPLPTSKALTGWLRGPHPDPSPGPGRGPRHLVIDPAGGWNDPLHAASAIVHADVEAVCAALLPRIARAADDEWLARWRDTARRARAAVDTQLAARRELFEDAVVALLAERLPDGATLYVGNSMPMRDLELCWPSGGRRVRMLCNRGANGIDGFVSSALGAAAGGAGPLVAVTGDLAFLHDLTGLLAAKRHRLRATFIVLNNDGGGIFSYLPQADGPRATFEALFLTPHGLDFRGGVEMPGCGFRRVRTAAELAAALDASLVSARSEVIEVPIDMRRSVAAHRALWAAAGRAARGETSLSREGEGRVRANQMDQSPPPPVPVPGPKTRDPAGEQ